MPFRTRLRFDPVAEAERQWRIHGWGDAADGMAVVTSIMRVQQLYMGIVDAVLRPHELTFARFEVLRLLAFTREGSLPLGKIGSRLQVHPASVTSAIDRLERQGFVVRVPHPTDGRAVLAEITPTGRAVVERATLDLNEQAFSQMPVPDSDVAELVRIMREIRRVAGDFDQAQADQPA
ncbi:MAG TPA: MarR family transcriptional regulator [Acidimicrobiales bacterium]|nr:MarR family transcriptional regulator [Acidimicrobiales bacterium]